MGFDVGISDKQKLDEMWSRHQETKRGDPIARDHVDTIFPPEVYFAKPQSASGIPAKSELDDEPGSGPCDIYKLDDSDPPALVAVTDFEKEVFNFSESPIGQDWITIGRTKFGKWTPLFMSDSQFVIGTMDEDISTGETKTMSVLGGTTLGDTGENLEVTDVLLGAGETISLGKTVVCLRYHDSWYIIAAECE